MRDQALSPTALLLFFVLLCAGASCGPAPPPAGGEDSPALEAPACDAERPCDDGLACCDGSCVELAASPRHCGACGRDCAAEGAYCASGGACAALAWGSLCENANLLALRDGIPADDAATEQVRDAVAARCDVSPQTASSTDANVVAEDGRPLVGVGTTVVTGGGGFFQPTVRYLEGTGETAIYSDQIDGGGTARVVRRADGAVLASVPSDISGEDKDYFVVYLAEEPVGGALVVVAYGFTGHGTRAAGWWVDNVLLSDPAGASRWYVIEWVESGERPGPDADDAFNLVADG